MQSNKSKPGFINGYKVTTLENNWNEERFDLNYIKFNLRKIKKI